MENSTTSLKVAPISFTPKAINAIKELIDQKELSIEYGLKVAVEGGGCSGFSYNLNFGKPEDGEDLYEIEGVNIILKKTHALYLMGTQVDYDNGLNARGFTFTNPNATSTCGCGSSFGV
ncbi:MAG: iron-sulfur cluster assembly protein [Sphingobacteriales bacterium]|jgi:iron-sulfur cluster assembly protein